MAPNGRVDVAFQALKSTNPTTFGTGNAWIDAYARSLPKGGKWSAVVKLTTVSSDPAASSTPESFVDAYLAEVAASPPGAATDISRLVLEPSGLDAAGMIAAISDPRLDRLGIPMLADFMAPEGSIYFDAIFGANHGQAAIRAWLVPAMAEIEFIEFVPMAESVFFDDAETTTLDEWQMVANMGEDKIPLSRGVSVRRHQAGWITWACDVYDTGPFRQPPPPEMEIEAAPLPDCPEVDWPIREGVTPPALSERARRVAGERVGCSGGRSEWTRPSRAAGRARKPGDGGRCRAERVAVPSDAVALHRSAGGRARRSGVDPGRAGRSGAAARRGRGRAGRAAAVRRHDGRAGMGAGVAARHERATVRRWLGDVRRRLLRHCGTRLTSTESEAARSGA